MRNWEPGLPYLVGYSQQLSARPGETVDVRVSTELSTFEADLVRLRHYDASTPGAGLVDTHVAEVAAQQVRGRVQPTPVGSVIEIPPAPFFDADQVTLSIWFLPTLFSGEQHLVSWLDDSGLGFELVLDSDGLLHGKPPAGGMVLTVGPLQLGIWHRVGFRLDRSAGDARLTARTRPRSPTMPVTWEAFDGFPLVSWKAGGAAIIIGGPSRPQTGTPEAVTVGTLFGRVADPALWAGPANLPDADNGDLIAHWDLGLDPGTDLCRDVGPHAHHGRLRNGGTRLVAGPYFADAGASPDSRSHNAVHLHGDDVLDAQWEIDLELDLPSTLAPGVYAVRLGSTTGEVDDHVPLFVRSGDDDGRRIALLLPTNTYLAYGNERMNFGTIQLPEADRGDRLQPVDRFIKASPWLGSSLYDQHADGSGVSQVSRHRPLVTMRPGHTSWLSNGPRHLSADLCLVDWLEHNKYSYDVLTDADLHNEGIAALTGYQVVLTGSHPEYVTGPMLDAIEKYLGEGGRLMYLGGNGFYWVTSFDRERPHAIEVRRGHAGSRTWESAPGDEFHSTTLERGGLWRHRGRPPNRLVGVGFAASGWGGVAGAYWVIRPVPERASFVFEGVDIEAPIGDFGLIMGGCVGDEVDRWDPELESPAATLRLATCEDLNDSYVIVIEDMIGTGMDITSETNPKTRADMVLLPTADGGAVFSVGSMAWITSLPHDDFNNNVSRVTRNVLDRFLDDESI